MSPRLGSILYRHILREIALACAGVLLVLLVLLVTNQLAFILGRIAGGQLAQGVLFEMLRLSVTENLGVILPVALLLGILVALGRLYHDSEMAAAQACGMPPATVHLAAGTVILACTALAAWVAFLGAPDGARRNHEIRVASQRSAAVSGLVPGQFRPVGADAVLYFRDWGGDGTLQDVFYQREIRGDAGPEARGPWPLEIVRARTARYLLAEDGSLAAVVLQDGHRYEGVPGSGAWRRVQFGQQTLPVALATSTVTRKLAAMQEWAALRASTDPRFRAELHWRYSAVLLPLLLGALAVPLARLRPRQGRYARVALGVLLYAVYANLLVFARTLVEKERVPDWLGMWWVHIAAVALGAAVLSGPAFWRRLRRRRHA
ncbi:MAG: hypothetical protein RL026_2403 [Pseudomonadota bacterium]|jgi:lipopolysaccharide export system permease protein